MVVIAGMVLLLLVGCGRQDAEQATFELVVASQGTVVRSVTASGRLVPVDQVEVGTQVSGTVLALHVDFNDEVHAGQILAELDPSSLRARRALVQASLSGAENEYQHQERNFVRMQTLFSGKTASQAELDEATYRLGAATASRERLRSELRQVQVDLGYTTIRSPIDGVVLARQVDPGQTVAASLNAPVLFVLARNLETMQVEADIDEADVGQVQAGQSVRFTVDAFPDKSFPGTVRQVRLNPKVTSNVVTYTAIVDAPNPEKILLPGLTANLDITVQEAVDVVVLPMAALKFQYGEAVGSPSTIGKGRGKEGRGMRRVWVPSGDTLLPRPVRTGIDDGSRVAILEGLQAGDSVVIGLRSSTAGKTGEKTTPTSNPFLPQAPGRAPRR